MYDRYYQEYCNEVHKALGSYLFWKMIQKRSFEEKDLLEALNRTPLSWVFVRHSFQVTLFITLGRIFDADSDAFSLDDLLKYCAENIDIFSLESLKKRKIKDQSGRVPDWLEGYIQKSYEPVAADFQRLRGEATKHRKVFEEIYRPIRHKLIAHNDKEYMENADKLWAKTNIGEMETILWFLHDIKETLFNAYHNGRKPELVGKEPDIAFYESDFGELLNSIKKRIIN